MESYSDKFKKKLKEINGDVTPPPSLKPDKRMYNIHKRSLPVGIDVVVVYNIESKEEAEYMINNAKDKKGKQVFATRVYQDDFANTKTLIYFDVIPTDATPKERSIFFNSVKAVQPL